MEFTNEQLDLIGISPELYNELNPEEKALVNETISALIDGDNSLYDELYYTDYQEIPVSFNQFITDDRYLGKSTRNGEFLYPFWKQECPKIVNSACVEVALSGAIGIGKTTMADLMIAYLLYRIMCMKDPQAFFNLSPGSNIVVAFLNNTLESSKSVGYETFMSFLRESPWFLEHGKLNRDGTELKLERGFDVIVGSKPQHSLGKNVVLALLDEVSFSPGQDTNYINSKIMTLYSNIRGRIDSRFIVNGKNYGKLFLVSSKSTEHAFLEAYIADQVKKGYPIYIVDRPIWEIKPGAYSGKTFKVAVGNKFLPSRIIRGISEEEIKEACEAYQKQGLKIIDVPVELMQSFDQDIDRALQDKAGISTSTVTKAFRISKIERCISEKYVNPFTTEVVILGLDDDYELREFFNPDLIPDFLKGAPVFIHLDASLSGDRTGLSGVAVIGTKQVVDAFDENKEPTDELVCQQVFTVGIQAPSDSQISFEKTRKFIYYLKDVVGLNIKGFSADGFQSADTMQILKTKGFNTKYTSLDRTPDGYDSLRSGINDQRLILLQGCNALWDELTDLERDNNTSKYDHPPLGKKDEADSLAGAYYDALQYKDEFIFFHPDEFDYEGLNSKYDPQKEQIKNILSSITKDKKQPTITVDNLGNRNYSHHDEAILTDQSSTSNFNSSDPFDLLLGNDDILLL